MSGKPEQAIEIESGCHTCTLPRQGAQKPQLPDRTLLALAHDMVSGLEIVREGAGGQGAARADTMMSAPRRIAR